MENEGIDHVEVLMSWGFTKTQSLTIMLFLNFPGEYIDGYDILDEIYSEEVEDGAPVPAKVRVLVKRCREGLAEIFEGPPTIKTKRGKGYIMSKKDAADLEIVIETEE